jgi:cystathionine beta-lyase/cystathionine gamma-synthase
VGFGRCARMVDRLSAGIEDTEDLLLDVERALDAAAA